MSRPRTPTKILEARGTFRKNPARKREGEPEVKDPLGAPPEILSPEEVSAWMEVADMTPMGVLTRADRLEVEFAARLVVKIRANFDKVNITALRHLHTVLGKFGMNPSDRSKLSIEKPKDDNPFGNL